MTATEINMEKEISSLRKAGRDREQDLETLNSVLQCNQDLINVRTYTHTHSPVNSCTFCGTRIHIKVASWHTSILIFFQDLRVSLGEKEQKLKEVEKEVELWRQKDRALTTVLQEKEAQISLLQTALQEVIKHVCLLSGSSGSLPWPGTFP